MMEGETAVFSCVGYGQHDVQITWWYNGALLTNSSLVYTFQEDLVVEGSAMVTLSTLLVCGGLVANSGAYTCSISNTVTTLNASVWLEVTPATGQLKVSVHNEAPVHLCTTSWLKIRSHCYYLNVTFICGYEI